MNVQDIRNGTAFLLDGQPYIGLKYEHVKMGRGSATIRIKMKNLYTGSTTEKSFINSARVEEINTFRTPMQFLYKDGDDYVFMNPQNYDQASLSSEVVSENAPYLKDGVIVNVLFWDEKPLWVELL
jgi:elongation factor P